MVFLYESSLIMPFPLGEKLFFPDGMVWYGKVQCGWHDKLWYSMVCGVVWYSIRCSVVWYSIRRSVVCYGIVWYGATCHSVLW